MFNIKTNLFKNQLKRDSMIILDFKMISIFFCSAFFWDFSLWLDRLSGDVSDTWRGPAM